MRSESLHRIEQKIADRRDAAIEEGRETAVLDQMLEVVREKLRLAYILESTD
jgi:hypothetical protein